MARTKTKAKDTGESIYGYFTRVFDAHPEWLKEKSNAAVLERYRKDHGLGPDAAIADNVKQGLANAKSQRRKKHGIKRRRGRRRAQEQPAAAANSAKPARTRLSLDTLEEHIDECLGMAKSLDREGLTEVIRMLRRARNEVIWKGGQP